MKRSVLALLLCLAAHPTRAQVYDTVDIHFALNDPKLNKEAINRIDSLIFHDVLIHGQKFTVLGYTDYLGGKAYNEALSKTRAKNVMDYLVNMGFAQADIALCMGKGKIERPPVNGKEGIASDRKVQIVIDGNPTPAQLAAAAAPPPKPIVKAVIPVKDTIRKKGKAAVAPAVSKNTRIDLTSISLNEAITLKNLLFYGDRHEVLPESMGELENLYKLMKENNMVKIQIEGHICCMDPKDGNDKKDEDNSGWLSETRAKAVADYLIEKGIPASRLKHKGFGNLKPLVPFPEKNESDRVKNRRVEIRIISK